MAGRGALACCGNKKSMLQLSQLSHPRPDCVENYTNAVRKILIMSVYMPTDKL